MFREQQTLRSITCLEITCLTNFEEYNMFREQQTLRGITCLENEQTLRGITCLENNKL